MLTYSCLLFVCAGGGYFQRFFIFAGRHSHIPFENFGKIIGIFKAQTAGNFTDEIFPFLNQPACMLHLRLIYEADKALAVLLFEQGGQIPRGNAYLVGHILKAEAVFDMAEYILPCLFHRL